MSDDVHFINSRFLRLANHSRPMEKYVYVIEFDSARLDGLVTPPPNSSQTSFRSLANFSRATSRSFLLHLTSRFLSLTGTPHRPPNSSRFSVLLLSLQLPFSVSSFPLCARAHECSTRFYVSILLPLFE